MKRCSVCATKIRDLALVCHYCGNDDFSKTLPQQLGELKKMIKEARATIKRMADVVAENAGIRNEYQDFDEVHDMAAKWLEKYNEVTQ